jgi:hypothetical protein
VAFDHALRGAHCRIRLLAGYLGRWQPLSRQPFVFLKRPSVG